MRLDGPAAGYWIPRLKRGMTILDLMPVTSSRRRALQRLRFGLRLRGRLEARQRLQPFDDGGVVGAVAELPLGGIPGRQGCVDQRRAGVGRLCQTRRQVEIAPHKPELHTGFEPPRDHLPPQDIIEFTAAELIAKIEHRGRLETEAPAEPDR